MKVRFEIESVVRNQSPLLYLSDKLFRMKHVELERVKGSRALYPII